MRDAQRDVFGRMKGLLRGFKTFQPRGDIRVRHDPQDALGNGNRDIVGVQRALGLEKNLFLFVLFADHHRRINAPVELLLDLCFDK